MICRLRLVVKVEPFTEMIDNCGKWDKVVKNLCTILAKVSLQDEQGWIDAVS